MGGDRVKGRLKNLFHRSDGLCRIIAGKPEIRGKPVSKQPDKFLSKPERIMLVGLMLDADYTGATIKPLGGGRLQFQAPGASLGVTIDHLAPGHRITVILAVSSTQLGTPVVIRT